MGAGPETEATAATDTEDTAASPPAAPEPEPGPEPPRRRRRRGRGKKLAVALFVLATGGAAAAAALGLGGGPGSGNGPESQLPPKSTLVAAETLRDTKNADGQLGHGDTSTLSSRLPGTVTKLPTAGDRVERGEALYELNGDPVVLMFGALPAYRALKTGDEGADVKQLEANLKALGYTGFTVDDEYTYYTAQAVKDWQDDRGLSETGTVELGRVVYEPAAIRVDTVKTELGAALGPGGPVLTHTGFDPAVAVELDTADRRLAKKGGTAEVVFPDDTRVTGRITDISTKIKPASGQDEEAETVVEVTVTLNSAAGRKAAERFDQAAVDVEFTAEVRRDVLTVPVSSLLALAEGGYGVEVVKGSTSHYVPVKTGLFADGKVEVSGDGITAGTRVGVPK